MTATAQTAFPLPLAPRANQGRPDVTAGYSPVVECRGETDENLIARIQDEDKEALTALFKRYGGLLRSVSLRILKNEAESDDLVQDLFLFIQRKCSVFDSSRSSARSWIVQMAYHRAIERRRYLATRQFYSTPAVQDLAEQVVGSPTTEEDYSPEAIFGRNGLNKVVEALSEDQRETLRLHFFEGYTLLEISEKLGQPHGNVRHHYYRAIDKLRKHMFGSKVRVAKEVESHGK
jgi:RNA polymerase sigma-70 factor (ECF subfamily)